MLTIQIECSEISPSRKLTPERTTLEQDDANTGQTFDGESLTQLIKKLVMTDADWIPKEKGYSLYIRQSFLLPSR